MAHSSEAEKLISRSAKGASYLMAVVASQRVLTFALNALLIRSVSPELLGFAASDMELLTATILFLSREASRIVALRAPLDALSAAGSTNGRRVRQQLVNMAWVPVPTGCFLALLAAWVFARRSSAFGKGIADESAGIALYCLSSLVETLAEPAYIMCQASLLFAARAKTEVAATIAKCLVTYILAAHFQLGARSFALGQLAFACVLAVGLWSHLVAHVSKSDSPPPAGRARGQAPGRSGLLAGLQRASAAVSSLLPRLIAYSPPARGMDVLPPLKPQRVDTAGGAWGYAVGWAGAQVGASNVPLLGAFAGQGLVKHALTEGDRLVLTALSSRQQRGAYAVVQNYGSLVVRLLFAPLEESTRALMSKLLAPGQQGGAPVAAPQQPSSKASIAEEEGRHATPAGKTPTGRRRTSASAQRRRGVSPGGRAALTLSTPRGDGLTDVPLEEEGSAPGSAPGSPLADVSDGPSGVRRRRARSPRASPLARARAAPEVPGGGALSQREAAATATRVYLSVLRLVGTAGLVIACFGPPLAPIAVTALLGSRWADSAVPSALAAYCAYIPALAVNGVTEAFATAAAGPVDLHRYNLAMGGATGAYALAAFFLLPRFGLPGLIGASALNMLVRIVVCWGFLRRYLAVHGITLRASDALPSTAPLAALVASRVVLTTLKVALGHPLRLAQASTWLLLCSGGLAAVGCASIVWASDRKRLAGAWAVLQGRSSRQDV